MNIFFTFLPIIILIILLFFNLLVFENTMAGPNQFALLIATLLGGIISYQKNKNINILITGIIDSIKSSTNAIFILLIIGGLTSIWILSGFVPAMIYYGVELMNPQFFLITTCLICSIVSISTGSSWTTAATIGIALIGIGNVLGINEGLVAGAIISGAYFGDKMSPLSETTNLAPSVSGTNLIDHIKYMTHTTLPSILITLIIFFVIGLCSTQKNIELGEIDVLMKSIESYFYIGTELFILPFIIIILVYKKFSAIKTLLIGVLTGIVFAYIFQKGLIDDINTYTNKSGLETIINTIFFGTDIRTNSESINNLLMKDGVAGMLWIVLLVITSMAFGGVMHAGGFLNRITSLLIPKKPTHAQLVSSTTGSCLFFNITTCDQYMAIVIPGRMFKEVYKDNMLDATNLSRTIEDSGTVTSVLVPWNSCAAYHSEMLAVNTMAYLPFCFFNIISPFMTLMFAYMNIKIRKLNDNEK